MALSPITGENQTTPQPQSNFAGFIQGAEFAQAIENARLARIKFDQDRETTAIQQSLLQQQLAANELAYNTAVANEQRMMSFRKDIEALSLPENINKPQAYIDLSLKYPEQADKIRATWANKSSIDKDASKKSLVEIESLISNGKPEKAIAQLNTQAGILRKDGNTSEADALDGLAYGIQTNPKDALAKLRFYRFTTTEKPDDIAKLLEGTLKYTGDGAKTLIEKARLENALTDNRVATEGYNASILKKKEADYNKDQDLENKKTLADIEFKKAQTTALLLDAQARLAEGKANAIKASLPPPYKAGKIGENVAIKAQEDNARATAGIEGATRVISQIDKNFTEEQKTAYRPLSSIKTSLQKYFGLSDADYALYQEIETLNIAELTQIIKLFGGNDSNKDVEIARTIQNVPNQSYAATKARLQLKSMYNYLVKSRAEALEVWATQVSEGPIAQNNFKILEREFGAGTKREDFVNGYVRDATKVAMNDQAMNTLFGGKNPFVPKGKDGVGSASAIIGITKPSK